METGKHCKSRHFVWLFVLASALEADMNHLPAHHCGYMLCLVLIWSLICVCVSVCVCVCVYTHILSLIIHSLQNFLMK